MTRSGAMEKGSPPAVARERERLKEGSRVNALCCAVL